MRERSPWFVAASLALFGLLTIAPPAAADQQFYFEVYGRPRILDVLPPYVSNAYVEVTMAAFTTSPTQVSHGAAVVFGGPTQTYRMTLEEAAQLAAAIQMWLLSPEEDVELFIRRPYFPACTVPTPRTAIRGAPEPARLPRDER